MWFFSNTLGAMWMCLESQSYGRKRKMIVFCVCLKKGLVDVNSVGGVYVGTGDKQETSLVSTQFCCEPKLLLKNKVYW